MALTKRPSVPSIAAAQATASVLPFVQAAHVSLVPLMLTNSSDHPLVQPVPNLSGDIRRFLQSSMLCWRSSASSEPSKLTLRFANWTEDKGHFQQESGHAPEPNEPLQEQAEALTRSVGEEITHMLEQQKQLEEKFQVTMLTT